MATPGLESCGTRGSVVGAGYTVSLVTFGECNVQSFLTASGDLRRAAAIAVWNHPQRHGGPICTRSLPFWRSPCCLGEGFLLFHALFSMTQVSGVLGRRERFERLVEGQSFQQAVVGGWVLWRTCPWRRRCPLRFSTSCSRR